MLKRQHIIILWFVTFISNPVWAGSIDYCNISSWMDWSPSCLEPIKPSFYIYDIYSYNLAVDDFNHYLRDVEIYLSCIDGEYSSDIKNLADIVFDDAQRLRDDIVNDLERARIELEYQRLLIN